MRFDQLTAAQRRQIRAAQCGPDHVPAGVASPYSRGKGSLTQQEASPGKTARPDRPLYRCHACGEEFAAWAPAERHGNQHGHHRIVWLGGAHVSR